MRWRRGVIGLVALLVAAVAAMWLGLAGASNRARATVTIVSPPEGVAVPAGQAVEVRCCVVRPAQRVDRGAYIGDIPFLNIHLLTLKMPVNGVPVELENGKDFRLEYEYEKEWYVTSVGRDGRAKSDLDLAARAGPPGGLRLSFRGDAPSLRQALPERRGCC